MPYADPEVGRERCRRRYRDEPAYRARAKARAKRRREDKATDVAAAKAVWYARNREAISEQRKAEYRADPAARARAVERARRRDPDAYRAYQREYQSARRARVRGATVERVEPMVVWERDEGVCGICGTAADRADWHLDHVIALARGGEHSYANTQVAHPHCNRVKGAG